MGGPTLPQALHWCRLSVRLKSAVQFMHIIAWETGTSTGAASPRAIHSFSRACGHIRGTAVRTVFQPGVRSRNAFKISPLASLQGPPNVQSPAAWSAMARLSVWNQSSRSPTELETPKKTETPLISQRFGQFYHLMQSLFLPCRQCNGDVRNFDPETVQHVIDDRFAHL